MKKMLILLVCGLCTLGALSKGSKPVPARYIVFEYKNDRNKGDLFIVNPFKFRLECTIIFKNLGGAMYIADVANSSLHGPVPVTSKDRIKLKCYKKEEI